MLWSRRGSATWEMRSWQAASSFSFSSIFLLLSDWVFSSCLQRFTIVFTSLFNLLMYRRATVNSSSIRPLPPSCCFEEKSSHTMAFVAVWFCDRLSDRTVCGYGRDNCFTHTLMSLLPTAIPISAKSLSRDDIISVILFFWWLDISFSFCSSESRDDRTDWKEQQQM